MATDGVIDEIDLIYDLPETWGRELRLVSGQWPTLETLHAFLEP
jgi:hypothetical protein